MKYALLVSMLFVATLAGARPVGAVDEPFSFYGLQFGMGRTEVAQRFKLEENLVKDPGHGLNDIELVFDREAQLMEIRASWPRPEDPFELQGLQRALREKFVAPISARFPAIAVSIDEYGNRAAVRLVLLSTAIREKNIDYHKSRFLKLLQ
jgi:hypothetical protein